MTDDRSSSTFEPYPFAEPTTVDAIAEPDTVDEPPEIPWVSQPPAASRLPVPMPPIPSSGWTRTPAPRRLVLGGAAAILGVFVVGSWIRPSDPLASEAAPGEVWTTGDSEPEDPETVPTSPVGEVALGDIATIPLYEGWKVMDLGEDRVILANGEARLIARTRTRNSSRSAVKLAEEQVTKETRLVFRKGSGQGIDESDPIADAGGFRVSGTLDNQPAEAESHVQIRPDDNLVVSVVTLLVNSAEQVIARQLRAMVKAAMAQW